MPLVIEQQCCACSRIAGVPTTTSRERRHSRFFSYREGVVAPRRAAPTAMRRHHVSETRCITPNTWGNTRLRRAAPRHAVSPVEPGVLLFLALTTCYESPAELPYLIDPHPNIPSGSTRIIAQKFSVIFRSIVRASWRKNLRIIYEYLSYKR